MQTTVFAKKAFSALTGALQTQCPEKLEEYRSLKNGMEKREWLAAFLVDPSSGGSTVSNTTSRSITHTERDTEIWVTEDEYGGPRYLNNPEMAKEAVKAMKPRPHRNTCLAQLGIKEYKLVKDEVTKDKTLKQEASMTTTADLEPGDVAGVAAVMTDFDQVNVDSSQKRGVQANKSATKRQKAASSGSGGPKGSTNNNNETVKTPQEKALEDAKEKLDESLKLTKSLYDKTSKELAEVRVVESRLKAKNWGEGPLLFLRTNTKSQADAGLELFQKWADIKSAYPDNLDSLKSARDVIDAARREFEKSYASYKRDCLSDFAKIK